MYGGEEGGGGVREGPLVEGGPQGGEAVQQGTEDHHLKDRRGGGTYRSVSPEKAITTVAVARATAATATASSTQTTTATMLAETKATRGYLENFPTLSEMKLFISCFLSPFRLNENSFFAPGIRERKDV